MLLSASFLFYARPSVAETLASPSQEIQQKGDTQSVKTPGADVSPATAAPAESSDAANDKAKPSAAESSAPSAEIKSESVREAEASSPTLTFTATAYALRGRTASGRTVARGLIAADRRVLPIGTRVRLEAGSYSGEYTVADTGGAVRGRKIDIWVPSTSEAMRFGRRPVKLTVLTHTRPRTAKPRAGK
jgi:3D (Asp-Asp-Asp) domain-containing protein